VFSKSNSKQLFSVTALIVMSATGSIAQPTDTSPNMYEDDLIRAKGLSASFVKDIATVNVLIENKSKKDILLAHTGYTKLVVTSDSGQSTTCYIQGIKINVESTNKYPESFSRLKPKGRATISATGCAGLDPSTTKNVSFNIDLTMWGKEQNSQFTLSLTSIPIKRITTR
jgi:hypothetical protein